MAALTITAANVIPAAGVTQVQGVAGEAITRGMPVFVDVDNLVKKSRANAAGTAKIYGIALNDAALNQPITIQRGGDITIGATVVVGESYWVSDLVAGSIIPAADLGSGDFPVLIGIAISTTVIRLNFVEAGVAKA